MRTQIPVNPADPVAFNVAVSAAHDNCDETLGGKGDIHRDLPEQSPRRAAPMTTPRRGEQQKGTMKTKRTVALMTCVAALGTNVQADDSSDASARPSGMAQSNQSTNRFGAGIIVGEPTGLALKYMLSDVVAIDGALGWSFSGRTDFYLHSDVLWHKRDAVAVRAGEVSFYCGVGGRLKLSDHGSDRMGIRVPVGVAYRFEDVPVDVFVEIAPVLDVAPSTRGDLTGGLGARWWF